MIADTMERTQWRLINERLRTGPLPAWPRENEVRLLPIRTPAERRLRVIDARKWAVENVRHKDGHQWSVRTDLHQDDNGRRYDVPIYWFSDLTTSFAFRLQFKDR
ncbi:hypothetical protein FV218_06585 [Methylobacterium sp. WL69]|uniref:hypothetical protein n=1 Tax=Methylobacterium sp. WL69 TaxID=2603893 RepID=UPI0011CA96EF|nr:hypothetical protein [Methylobacterium sp. WL69]TXM76605.1 hypothetical protein FV218_06585 [Methylobacterium sp. WL69]